MGVSSIGSHSSCDGGSVETDEGGVAGVTLHSEWTQTLL